MPALGFHGFLLIGFLQAERVRCRQLMTGA
jgi:hypothetical protein